MFETLGRGTSQFSQRELLILQKAARPNVKFQEAEFHHNQEVSRLAGKQEWEPINLVWYDAEQNPDISRGVYYWLETVVNMQSMRVAHPSLYKRTASLLMLDGVGQTNERWTLVGTWPSIINWKELDYTSNELQTIEVTVRFDRAIRDCLAIPAPQPITPNCAV